MREDGLPRNDQIVQLRRDGKTLQEIADTFGLTRERVRQITTRAGVGAESARGAGRRQRAAAGMECRRHVARTLSVQPGLDLDALAEAVDRDAELVRAVLTPAMKAALGVPARTWIQSRWTPEEMLELIRGAAEVQAAGTSENPLTGPLYDEARELIGGPSRVRISQTFGKWSAAVAAAGLVSEPASRRLGSRFSDDALYEFVVEYLLDPCSGSRSFAGFTDWRNSHQPSAPSGVLIRQRLGPWADIRAEAWVRAAKSGRLTPEVFLVSEHELGAGLSDDELWAAEEVLAQLSQLGQNVADIQQYENRRFEGAPSSEQLIGAYGSWGLFLGTLGIDPTALVRTVGRPTRQEMLAELCSYVERHFEETEGLPSQADWQRDRDPSRTVGPWAYNRLFGNWDAAVEAALS